MQQLLSPPDTDLDPETAAIVEEVCTALEWFDPQVPGSHEPAMAQRFGRKWWIAFRNTGDHECRQRIYDCCDAIVRGSGAWMAENGMIFTQEQIRFYHGRESYTVDSQTGKTRRMIEWPTGTYAGGQPSYERPEAAA